MNGSKNLITCCGLSCIFIFSGCESFIQQRAVRLAQDTNSDTWRVNVNGIDKRTAASASQVTNILSTLALHQGDLIVLGNIPDWASAKVPGTFWNWVMNYCHSNSVAVYEYIKHVQSGGSSSMSVPGQDMFRLPIYHWSSPYDHPRDIERSTFFREGEFLGCGTVGFQNMLTSITKTRPKRIFILGSLYNLYGSYGPHEEPYEKQQDILDQVLKRSGTEPIILDPEYGF